MTTTTYTKEEWDSRKLTYSGAFCALFDIMLMGIYLIGGIAFLRASGTENTLLMWGYLAAGVFLVFNAIGKFINVMHPRDWYETEITMNKNTSSENIKYKTRIT